MLNLPLPAVVQDYLNSVIRDTLRSAYEQTGWDFHSVAENVSFDLDLGPADYYILSVCCYTTNHLGEKMQLWSRMQLTNMSMIAAQDDAMRMELLCRAVGETTWGLTKEILKTKGFDFDEEHKRHMENKDKFRVNAPFHMPLVVDPNMPKDEVHLKSGDKITKIKIGPQEVKRDPKWK